MNKNYVCPYDKTLLKECDKGLMKNDGKLYPYIKGYNDISIIDFSDNSERTNQFIDAYDKKESVSRYNNFLSWLFETFNTNEFNFRCNLIKKLNLKNNYKVLITGCGLGDDIKAIIDTFGNDGEFYICDLSKMMVTEASRINANNSEKISFFVCDAHSTPFVDNFFDGAFHFGGINLFTNIELAVKEMDRVVKPNGRVVFGDEGIAPWLRDTEYAKIAINNNQLWGLKAPIDILPKNAIDVNLSWVLGNCFYVIDFTVSNTELFMNIDIQHIGLRGGSMRTRYFGVLEGVSEGTKTKVINEAKKNEMSVHLWLENLLSKELYNK